MIAIALCGVCVGLLWARGVKPLALALAGVLVCSVGAVEAPHVAWHALAPCCCLLGVLHSTKVAGLFEAAIAGGLAAGVLSFLNLERPALGWALALCHGVAFSYGLHAYHSRVAGSSRLAGVVVVSCAPGVVGSLLWGYGWTTRPAQIADLVLYVVLILLAR